MQPSTLLRTSTQKSVFDHSDSVLQKTVSLVTPPPCPACLIGMLQTYNQISTTLVTIGLTTPFHISHAALAKWKILPLQICCFCSLLSLSSNSVFSNYLWVSMSRRLAGTTDLLLSNWLFCKISVSFCGPYLYWRCYLLFCTGMKTHCHLDSVTIQIYLVAKFILYDTCIVLSFSLPFDCHCYPRLLQLPLISSPTVSLPFWFFLIHYQNHIQENSSDLILAVFCPEIG
jgi:hypothetical protein